METTEHEPQPMFDELPPSQPDLRRVVAFVVCALAAIAVFLVARSTGPDPQRAQAAVTSTTAAPEERTPRSESGEILGRGDEGDTEEGFLCRMLAERMEGTGLCGTTRERPRTRPEAPASERETTDASGTSPAGWTTTSETLDGWEFSFAHPEDWSPLDTSDGLGVKAPDERVAVTATGGPSSGRPVAEMTHDYVTYLRADFAPDLEVLDEGPLRLDGFDGYRVRYSGTSQGQALEGEAWLLIREDMLWIVLQVQEPGDEAGEQLGGQVAGTFQVTAEA